MTLTDTGPIVALLDTDDPSHETCVAASEILPPSPLLTTWPCFTEAMYLLGEAGGYRYQAALWSLYLAGRLVLHELSSVDMDHMASLMAKYRDAPMDLADASLITVAESGSLRLVFTLDSHFRFYRLADGSVLEVVP